MKVITQYPFIMSKSWYQIPAQSLVNMLLPILRHNRLPYQQYDLLKTTSILALLYYHYRYKVAAFILQSIAVKEVLEIVASLHKF